MDSPLRISISELQSQYEAVSGLGRGNSGSVYVYRHREDGGEIALKIVKTDRCDKRADALAEIQILQTLEHQRIVKIFKYYDESFSAFGGDQHFEIGLLLQRGLGSLQQYVKDRTYHYDFTDILRFIVKFIELGAYLESKAIVHRDIKPGNIIIFNNNLEFKLGDFGLSCRTYERPRGFAGTPAYCSPGLKKFYKEGDHRQHPPTNAFKDDVYSFALTSSQVIKHRYPLESCPREITTLLDEMLKNDERQRPTFTHLMHHETVQKYLKECGIQKQERQQQRDRKVELAQRPIQMEAFTRKKIGCGEFSELNHHTQKSRKIKHQQSLNCGRGVRTLCSFSNRYVLAGTDEGKLFVLDRQSGQSTRLSLTHSSYVAKVASDRNGDVWTAGGDGKVYFIQRQQLLRCIQCNKSTLPAQKKASLFSKSCKDPPANQIITLPEQSTKLIIDGSEEQSISNLFCEDLNHFAVGYCSGAVRVRWGQESIRSYRIHCQPITSLQAVDSTLFSGDFGGLVKSYSLSKRIIDKSIYKFSPELIDFSVTILQNGRNIQGISSRGQLQTINLFKSSRTTFHAELSAKNLVGAVFRSKHYYLLSADGCLYFKNTLFLKLNGSQWNCLVELEENQLMIGSRDGEVCIVTFQ